MTTDNPTAAPDYRHATDRGLTTWHIIAMTPYASTSPALCGALPIGGAWIGYTTVQATWQQVCPECARMAGTA